MNVLSNISAVPAVSDALWYKDAIIYQLHVKTFADSNDDGIGDFKGLTQRLDYLQELGVTALWLQPFYPSPGRDDGYDIADYGRINPDFGTMKDFRRFMAEAKNRGMKVITELVINHTSDQHPWFQRARHAAPGSEERDWYVWSDTDQRYLGTRIIFTDIEKSNWSWDPEAGAYYWHRFFSHQPDLNYANPRVFEAVVEAMRGWLDLGVDGFRLDAIPYLCEREGTSNENLPETHELIRKLRAEVEAHPNNAFLLAEANQWPEDIAAYFGAGDECQMAYHFPLMPRIYMAIAQEDRFPINDILRQTPDIPANCQWALFLRNHDELTLEMVSDAERDYLWSTYAADPRARIYLGIRRRLAPLMDNDRRKIELMNSLLLSFPGTPIIYYGDELGMGDNIYLGDRNSVRTPMQWTPDRNGGFSRCDPAKLFLPPIMDPVYGYHTVNVEAQSRSLSSLLSWTKRMIAVRQSSQVFGRGSLEILRPANRAVLAYLRQYGGEVLFCVANLSRSAQSAEIDLSTWKGRVPIELLGRTRFRRIDDAPFVVTLAPYGFFWFQLSDEATLDGEGASPVPEWVTLVLSNDWRSLVDGRSRQLLEHDVLPAFLASRRWFSDKSGTFKARLDASVPFAPGDPGSLLVIVEVSSARGISRYALPLAVRWGRVERGSEQALGNLLSRVRRANREGALVDALPDADFVAWFITQIHQQTTLTNDRNRLEFRAIDRFSAERLLPMSDIRAVGAEQSSSTIAVGRSYVLKCYRRLATGIDPEIEMGRFLTDVGYVNTPALLGTAVLAEESGRSALAVLHEFVENQGDEWTHTAAYLDRFLEEERLLVRDVRAEPDGHAGFLNRMRQIGRRIAELHVALSSVRDNDSFAPEPVTSADSTRWTDGLAAAAQRMFEDLARRREGLDPRIQELVQSLLAKREPALDRIRAMLPAEIAVDKIRQHGNFHLGQILVVKDDAYIIDFAGEPDRSHAERRQKAPAARDIASFIRSLDYAGAAALDRMVKAPAEEYLRLTRSLDDWRLQSTQAFLASIAAFSASPDAGVAQQIPADLRSTGPVGQPPLWPSEPQLDDRLLRFFMVERAVQEIGYEFANRPSWVRVPLGGLYRALFAEER
jgi:maltose alpha-D-glucosyltransferase / alpha-amylase